MSQSQDTTQFTVKPAGANPQAINDWFDLDAIFADDFFPHEVDFSALISEDETMNARAAVAAAAAPPAGARNLRAKAPPAVAAPPVATKSQRKAAATSRRPPPVESEDDDDDDLSDGQRVERRDRNREHAKKSRIRKRVLLDTLQDQLTHLRNQNVKLRRVVSENLPPHLASHVLLQCTTEESTLLAAPAHSGGTGGGAEGASEDAAASTHRPSALTANIASGSWMQGAGTRSASAPSSSGAASAKTPKVLMEPDYRLIQSLITSQQNFVLSDPSLPDNPIVYASDGFCRLSGYRRQDVLGRNCRFLQGPGTDQAAVDVIRQGVIAGRDVSVCLLNYRADGTPFWNQFFLGALKDAQGQVVNYVGVQCEVNNLPVSEMKDRVKRLPLPGV